MATNLAVLVLAYGSPQTVDEVAPYLQDVRGGRLTSPELLAAIQARYAAIGGSPLNRLTAAQAEAVQAELARRGLNVTVYVGMRHWTPWIRDALAAMQADGVRAAVAIVMAPHYSRLSVGRYRERVDAGLQDLAYAPALDFVESWWEQEAHIAQQVANLRAALAAQALPAGARRRVLFTAHSLPTRIKAMDDRYDEELQANAAAIAARIPGLDWEFAFQSAGASPEPWLGPPIEERLPALAAAGYTHVLAQPVGFVCDHVEIVYDLDIEAQTIAREHGLSFARTASMNTLPGFITAVADTLEPRLRALQE